MKCEECGDDFSALGWKVFRPRKSKESTKSCFACLAPASKLTADCVLEYRLHTVSVTESHFMLLMVKKFLQVYNGLQNFITAPTAAATRARSVTFIHPAVFTSRQQWKDDRKRTSLYSKVAMRESEEHHWQHNRHDKHK